MQQGVEGAKIIGRQGMTRRIQNGQDQSSGNLLVAVRTRHEPDPRRAARRGIKTCVVGNRRPHQLNSWILDYPANLFDARLGECVRQKSDLQYPDVGRPAEEVSIINPMHQMPQNMLSHSMFAPDLLNTGRVVGQPGHL